MQEQIAYPLQVFTFHMKFWHLPKSKNNMESIELLALG